jgi:hypothetical protein
MNKIAKVSIALVTGLFVAVGGASYLKSISNTSVKEASNNNSYITNSDNSDKNESFVNSSTSEFSNSNKGNRGGCSGNCAVCG